MSLPAALLLGLVAGAAIGTAYFLWLWTAVRDLGGRGRAGLWFAAGLFGRFAFALAGFGLLARFGGLPVLVPAVGGFIAARTLLRRRLDAPPRGPEGTR